MTVYSSKQSQLGAQFFLIHLSMSTCFGGLCAHTQEKRLYLCDTWYLLFCLDDCLVCRVEINTLRNKHTKKNCAPSCLYLQDYFIVILSAWFYCRAG